MYSRFLLFLLLAHLNDAKKAGAHRYWRLQAPGTTKWGVLEVRWLDAESGETVVPGSDAAVLSSGSHAAWCSGSAAADGDDKSYRLSKAESEDRWIGVDFGEGGGAEVGAAEVMQVAHDNYRAFLSSCSGPTTAPRGRTSRVASSTALPRPRGGRRVLGEGPGAAAPRF